MFLVRNRMHCQLGRRSELIGLMKELHAEATKELGLRPMRILTGCVGPSDQTVVMESEHESLASFESELAKLNSWPGMSKFGEKWASLLVPGSTAFEIYRIQG